MSDCIFCAVVRKDAEASIVYEDETVVAFMDLQPVTTGHLLVVPREHMAYLADVPAGIGGHLFTVAQTLAAALRRSGLPCEGVNLFLADGEAAFQEVFHTHLHVFPRTKGDGFGLVADWRVRPRPELDDAAAAVRSGLLQQVRLVRRVRNAPTAPLRESADGAAAASGLHDGDREA